MSVETEIGATFQFGAPTPLFTMRLRPAATGSQYEVSADGQRFLVNQLDATTAATQLIVMVNWRTQAQERANR